MRKLLGCLLFVPILTHAEIFYDAHGKAFMISNRVGNQVFYTTPDGRPIANSVATPVIPPLTPNLMPPTGILVNTQVPQLPQLLPIEVFK
jgi:hypothetical protein